MSTETIKTILAEKGIETTDNPVLNDDGKKIVEKHTGKEAIYFATPFLASESSKRNALMKAIGGKGIVTNIGVFLTPPNGTPAVEVSRPYDETELIDGPVPDAQPAPTPEAVKEHIEFVPTTGSTDVTVSAVAAVLDAELERELEEERQVSQAIREYKDELKNANADLRKQVAELQNENAEPVKRVCRIVTAITADALTLLINDSGVNILTYGWNGDKLNVAYVERVSQ